MDDPTVVKIAAIVAVAVIAVAGLTHGVDTVLLGTAMAIIGGIAGYVIRAVRK